MPDPSKNTRTLITVLAVVAFMVGLSFASVPLYRLFCQATGFGGTTQRAAALPGVVLERTVTIHFDANTASSMPWSFRPEKEEETVKLGQQGLIAFVAKSQSGKPTEGTALFNVTPAKAGQYFHKIQCFCFDKQQLMPGEEMHMPVVFYVDPKMAEDKEMDDVTAIALSYTFYPSESEELDKAMEAFYNTGED